MFAYMLASKPCSEAIHRDYFISRGLFFAKMNELKMFVLEINFHRACLKNFKCNIFTFKKQYGKINESGK